MIVVLVHANVAHMPADSSDRSVADDRTQLWLSWVCGQEWQFVLHQPVFKHCMASEGMSASFTVQAAVERVMLATVHGVAQHSTS